ncbi:MAG: cadherin-like beta sandwich domain-containing protein [Bacilli bacterium]
MRKSLKYLMVFFSVMLMFIIKVDAASFTITPSSQTIKVNGYVTLTIALNGYTDSAVLSSGLDYDRTIIMVESSTPVKPIDNKFSVKQNGTIITIKFKGIKEGNTTVKFFSNNPNVNDATANIVVANPVITTTQKPATTSKTSAETTTQNNVTTIKPLSNNNKLKSLGLNDPLGNQIALSPEFNSEIYEYSATVDGSVESVSVAAILDDPNAKVLVLGDGQTALKPEEVNKISISVTAENGEVRQYLINVTREKLNTNATLKSLTIAEVPKFMLIDNKYRYIIKLDKKFNVLTLLYFTTDEKSTVEIKGNENLEDGSKVKIIVTAPDKSKKEYILEIVKGEIKKTTTSKKHLSSPFDRNPLIIMTLSVSIFGLIGAIIYVAKK